MRQCMPRCKVRSVLMQYHFVCREMEAEGLGTINTLGSALATLGQRHGSLTPLLASPSLLLACRLVDDGFNPAYGARPLRRAIMRLIEDCLSERILTGEIKEGDVVIMDVGECDDRRVHANCALVLHPPSCALPLCFPAIHACVPPSSCAPHLQTPMALSPCWPATRRCAPSWTAHQRVLRKRTA